MARVIDYAWGRPSITALKGAGAVAVCRYLSWLPNGKCLSKTEADTLRTGGIDVVSNWEYYGDWQHDYSGGYARGVEHATEAQRQHLACGGPRNRPIYFSTDFNPTAAQLPTIGDYYRGVASVIGITWTGAYGGYPTIKYLFDAGLIRWGWQTYGWSGSPTMWDPRAQLRQVQNGVTVGGVDCDLNDSMTADFGQWGMEGEDMDAVQNYRLKILFENWDPSRDQWVAAGGDPAVWDAATAAGTARNGVKQQLNTLATGMDGLAKQVTALAAQAQAIGTPTQAQVNTAILAAMLDPRVQKGIGDAIATHMHVS